MSGSQEVRHVIAGAGPIGSGLALRLAEDGERVTVVTRSGGGPQHALIDRVKGDVADADWFTSVVVGAATVVNAVNPPYGSWDRDWPPLHRSFVRAASDTGARLVSMENLYGYGKPAHPGGIIQDGDPLRPNSVKGRVRAEMSEAIFALHASGALRASAIRASDFFGPFVTDAHIGERGIGQLLAGKTVQCLGRIDVPHTVSFVPDVVAALAVAVHDDRALGRAWHAPAAPAVSVGGLWKMAAQAAGRPTPKLQALKGLPRKAVGLVMPVLRQVEEIAYQFDEPWIMESTDITATFGLEATPLPEAMLATMQWWQNRPAVAA
jgi:nucleoside-diphosphate-sugar epimerase